MGTSHLRCATAGPRYPASLCHRFHQWQELKQRLLSLLRRVPGPIPKKIALRDVYFSNSLVESVNKLLKYRYLFPKQVASSAALTTHLAASIQDYNDVRPHGSLNGLTPSEAYQGQGLPEKPYSALLKAGFAEQNGPLQLAARLTQNRQDKCGICPE